MTLRDLTEQGIELQGYIRVQSWDDDKEDEVIHFVSNPIDALVIFPEKIIDKEITYIYPTMGIDPSKGFDIPVVVIEINH